MSEKFKTLKDLKFDAEDIFVKKADLRKEAIKRAKWFKKLAETRDSSEYCDGEGCENEFCKCFNEGRLFELKEFFDITNEELKEGEKENV